MAKTMTQLEFELEICQESHTAYEEENARLKEQLQELQQRAESLEEKLIKAVNEREALKERLNRWEEV